jgi:hypothetical protein
MLYDDGVSVNPAEGTETLNEGYSSLFGQKT